MKPVRLSGTEQAALCQQAGASLLALLFSPGAEPLSFTRLLAEASVPWHPTWSTTLLERSKPAF